MALDDDIRILSGVGLFADLTAEQLRLLAFGAETMRFSVGREIYAEDAPADCAYVVASGQVVLYREINGGQTVLARLGPGAILGELALITETKRLTSAAAEADVEVVRLNRTLFRRILEEYPELAAHLHSRITAELQDLLERIERVGPRFSS
ncbi:cyclic nucleotide-binding domain-containing protein [Aquamicrobium sp. LC103]|uniref:cyclic nucleotide-binding domain-containing protein n=1 Tax=Aquamicrobium sp. LC103 TaxID=1120658 RepID=UPI00063E8BF7|nr:cyclic nucleotide-binding domain-containing protein [Aquamicrobium sp. LC103]TKT82923.1 cyclic nucleotide-binding domain-containing protein [Aquamicrobium sp. LC103]